MKFIYTLIFLSVFSIPALSQSGNLAYSETKYIKLDGMLTNDGVVTTQALVVPEGQTWKIESAGVSYKYTSAGSTSYSYSTYLSVLLDQMVIFRHDSGNHGNHYNFPIWLPSGTYELTLWSDSSWPVGNYFAYASVSVLVFNVTTN